MFRLFRAASARLNGSLLSAGVIGLVGAVSCHWSPPSSESEDAIFRGEATYAELNAAHAPPRLPHYVLPHDPGLVKATDIPMALPPVLPKEGIAAHNAAVTGPGGSASRELVDDAAHIYTLHLMRPRPQPVRSLVDAKEALRAVAVVFSTRGCHPDVAKALLDTATRFYAGDKAGFAVYVVDDATPADVVDWLAHYSGLAFSEPWSGGSGRGEGASAGSSPLIAILNRASATHRKYVMPQAAARADTSALRAALHALPTGASVSAFTEAWIAGGISPTLYGQLAPPGAQDPVEPALAVVTSQNFQEIVLDPSRDVLLETYLTGCPACNALAPRIRMLAYLADRFFPRIRVAQMNVDENNRPRDWIPGEHFPKIQIYNGGATSHFSKLRGPACGGEAGSIADDSRAVPLAAVSSEELVAEVVKRQKGASIEDASPQPTVATDSGWQAYTDFAYKLFFRVPVDTATDGVNDSAVRAIGCTCAGTVPCVPSLDTTKPLEPTRIILPSVPELVLWAATHSSQPFDPAEIRVPQSELRGSSHNTPSDAVTSESQAAEASSGEPTISLMALAADMEADAELLFGPFYVLNAFLHAADEIEGEDGIAHRSPEYAELALKFRALVNAARDDFASIGYGSVKNATGNENLKGALRLFDDNLRPAYIEWRIAREKND